MRYLEEGMYVRLRGYSLYRILRLRYIGTINIHVSSGDIISRITLTIWRWTCVSLLSFNCLRTTRAKDIAIIFAGTRQFLLHIIRQTGECQFCELRRIRCAKRMRYKAFHTCVGYYYVYPIVFSIKDVYYLQRKRYDILSIKLLFKNN